MRVAVALGSNLGDRAATLRAAVERLADWLDGLRASAYRETAPTGPAAGVQPPYLNAVAVGTTTIAPRTLLGHLLALERELGRERPFPHAPRTLDLDLILYGDVVMREPDLEIPHPRFRERSFVLEPLAEIAPELLDPVTGRTVAALYAELRG